MEQITETNGLQATALQPREISSHGSNPPNAHISNHHANNDCINIILTSRTFPPKNYASRMLKGQLVMQAGTIM